MGAVMNYNGYFQSEIVKPEMFETTLPTERDADRFGYIQNKVARWMEIEPQMADYVIRRGFPGLVNNPIAPGNLINFAAKKANLEGEEMGGNVGTTMSYGGNMTPWLSREQWGPSNEWVQDFFKLYRTNAEARRAYNTYMEANNEKRAKEILQQYPLIEGDYWTRIEYVKEKMSEFYDRRKEIKAMDISENEKEALLRVEADMPMSMFAMEEMRAILYFAEGSN